MYIAGVLKTIKFKSSDEIHFILIFELVLRYT